MYADRHAASSTIDPRSLGIAVALNGAVVAALLLAQPVFKVIDHRTAIHTYPVLPDPPPPPPLPEPAPRHPLQPRTPADPHPLIDLNVPKPFILTELPRPSPSSSVDVGPAMVPTATPTPELATIPAEVDPAHRGDLQPTYPAGELRAEHEGVVTVRVLIGVDGRVRQVEQVAATSEAFFRATQERALARWRFRPATRGGVPVEAWRAMTIRFVIPR